MFVANEKDANHIAFAQLITKLINGAKATIEDRTDLKRLAKVLDLPSAGEDCYWICDSNFACDPANAGPACNCHKVCI